MGTPFYTTSGTSSLSMQDLCIPEKIKMDEGEGADREVEVEVEVEVTNSAIRHTCNAKEATLAESAETCMHVLCIDL